MVSALRALATQMPPSAAGVQGLMDGLEVVAEMVQNHIDVSLIENYELLGVSG